MVKMSLWWLQSYGLTTAEPQFWDFSGASYFSFLHLLLSHLQAIRKVAIPRGSVTGLKGCSFKGSAPTLRDEVLVTGDRLRVELG